MLYKVLRPVLAVFSPEGSTTFLLRTIQFFRRWPFVKSLIRLRHCKHVPELEKEVFGIRFSSPVGVAAGLDRSGEFVDLFSDFGFSFIEVGSLTPRPQQGEPKPRVFRLPKDKALLSRTGHPNKGVKHAISVLSRRKSGRSTLRIGVNIAPQSGNVTEEQIISDYRTAFALTYDFADYFVVNLTSSIDPDSGIQADAELFSDVMDEILEMRLYYDVHKPILIKISSDLTGDLLDDILDYAMMAGVDGIVAGGPAGRSAPLATDPDKVQSLGTGGISGRPLLERTLDTVRHIRAYTSGRLPIVACGGIMTPKDAVLALEAGASLVEMYSAIYYKGPRIAKKTIKRIASATHDHSLDLHDRR